MKKQALFLMLFCIFLLVPHETEATFELLDGKLRIKGRLEQYFVFLTNLPRGDLYYRHRGGPALSQSIFTFEGLYTVVDDGNWWIARVVDCIDHQYGCSRTVGASGRADNCCFRYCCGTTDGGDSRLG